MGARIFINIHYLRAVDWPRDTRLRKGFRFYWNLGVLLGLLGCREEPKGEAPPEPVVPRRDVCAQVGDAPQEGLPGRAVDYCIDPDSDIRRYGTSAPSPLDSVCVELFNGECELYKSYGLDGVKTLRYVPAAGGTQSVNVVVSSFRRSEGAFGFFTRRILGDGLPSQITVKEFPVQGRAVIGIGMALIWRGKQVVELTYVSEEETPQEIEAKSGTILQPLAEAVSKNLVGKTSPERAVRVLEELKPETLGVLVASDGLLGVSGTGPGAVGFFADGDKRHRLLVAERRDEDGAKDLLKLLRRAGIGKKLKGRDVVRLRLTAPGRAPETWYVARSGRTLLGVGPSPQPGSGERSTPQERKSAQSRWEVDALSLLSKGLKTERSLQ